MIATMLTVLSLLLGQLDLPKPAAPHAVVALEQSTDACPICEREARQERACPSPMVAVLPCRSHAAAPLILVAQLESPFAAPIWSPLARGPEPPPPKA